jgi:hypothetical protein
MPNRTFIDMLLGRHYCPMCGQAAGFKQEHSKTKKVRWYQLAPTDLFCNACGTKVVPILRPAVIPCLLLLVTVVVTVFITLEKLAMSGQLATGNAKVAQWVLVGILVLVGPFLIQHFLVYKSAPQA